MIFADDLQIYWHATPTVEERDTLVQELSSDATAIIKWSRVNDLKLNSSKTVALLLGSLQYLLVPALQNPPPILVGGAIINFSSGLKSLGIIISSSLNFKDHLNHICSQIYASPHILRYYEHALTGLIKKI